MASLNSFPFTIEARMENRVLLHSSFGFQVVSCHRKKPLDWCSSFDSKAGLLKITQHNRRGLWRDKLVRATMEESGDGKGEKETEDALQATIEKSKKALAMQKELLQQIAERRKLVSSIKSSIINPNDELSMKDTDKTSPKVDIGTNSKSVANDHPSSVPSGKNVDSALSTKAQSGEATKAPAKTHKDSSMEKEVMMPSKFNGSSGDGRKEITERSSHERTRFTVDSSRKTEKISTLPDFLSKTSQSSNHTDKKDEKLEESTSNEMSDQVNDPRSEDAKPPPLAGPNVMNIILVAAECAPWVKTGGLGDVAGALPKAFARRGHRVMVVVPRYGNYAEPQDTGVRKRYRIDGQDMEVSYFQIYIDGVDFVFIDSPTFRHMEKNIYGGSRLDILKRMVLFCKAAVEVPWHVPCGGVCYGDGNLVFIANDWHTALLPVYLKAYYRDNGLMKYTRSVLVIHNIAHQEYKGVHVHTPSSNSQVAQEKRILGCPTWSGRSARAGRKSSSICSFCRGMECHLIDKFSLILASDRLNGNTDCGDHERS